MYHVHATSHVLFLKFLGGSKEPPEPPLDPPLHAAL